MSTTVAEVGPSAWEARSGPKLWEKQVQDVADEKEAYTTARNIGTARLDYSRLTTVGQMAEDDTVDYYTFNTTSQGNLRISLRDSDSEEDEDPLDMDVNDYLEAAGIEIEEDEYTETQTELEEMIEDLTAQNVRLEVFTVNRKGEEVMIADSTAEEDSDEYAAFESLAEGEYRTESAETYYIRISRIDENDTDEYQYALQVQLGEDYENNCLSTEQEVDTSTSYEGKSGAYVSSEGQAAIDAVSTYGAYELSPEAEEAMNSAITNGYTSTYVAGQSAVSVLASSASSSYTSSSTAVSLLRNGGGTSDLFDSLI